MSRTPPADWGPWTIAGDPDPDFDDADRVMHHFALTDRNLLKRYKQQFADADADYDAIVRRLGHVWDCPEDRAANVAGFRCASCGRTRAQALERSRAINLRSGGQPRRAGFENVAYVRRLCRAFAEDGVDGLVERAPDDVEWIPSVACGRVLRGSGELRTFLTERGAPGPTPRPTSITSVGVHVLVRFDSPPVAEPSVLWSRYQFVDRRLVRAITYSDEGNALRAAA